ncbi:MAG TPA: heme ABC transporter ATP-binding protein [Puia sp.]|jgi:iron complex transport system ATP-binding protein|nr:heme ABC transporter ATP-binding protein [Puia sp.]
MLRIENLVCRAGGRVIVDDITAGFPAGMMHVIVGPNGSGKSTFLKAFSGDRAPDSGRVLYDGVAAAHLDKAGLARRRAVMSQLPELHFPLRVDDIVMMGRYPHFAWRPAARDREVCRMAMEQLGISGFADRDYLTLSGGERQRVQFARALAQIADQPAAGSRYFFLDEPVSSLDIRYQHQLLQTARSLVSDTMVLIVILHDLNLALQYADRIVFMKEGRIVAAGDSPGIVTSGLVREVFDVSAHLLDDPYSGARVIVYG